MRPNRDTKSIAAALMCATFLGGAVVHAAAADQPVFRYKSETLGGGTNTGGPGPDGPNGPTDPSGPTDPDGPTDPEYPTDPEDPDDEVDPNGPTVVVEPGTTVVTPGNAVDGGGFSITYKAMPDPYFSASRPIATYCVTVSGGGGNYDLNFTEWDVSSEPWFKGADIVQPGQRGRDISAENARGQSIPAVYPYGNSGAYYPGNLFESNGVTWRTSSHDVCVRIALDLAALPAGKDIVTPVMTITGQSWSSAAVEKDGELVYDPENYSYVKWSWENGPDAVAEHRFRLRISR